MSTALSSSHDAQAHSPAPDVALPESSAAVRQAAQSVSDISHARLLSDEEREHHIRSCTRLMELAYDRYCETSDLGDRGEADRWRVMRDEAIRGRSAAQIARMESERGLS